ncbi:MAP kinase-activating death domain protein isoform X5 [Octopus sinensis]|uniref:MAP kinase-activating death domain protein n=1 Tax=Octopus sinensis TaxID=2607531 RepID=A0A6P7S6Z7_9MOLL|nr:MAP kinase-activating death domain protein isoform X5 [Octopus sinensis]
MCEYMKKYFSPRLLDYIVIVGTRNPYHNNNVAQTPELLRRYPVEDHKDFPLPNDVIFFCQPEGCISEGPRRTSLRETTPFVFTLTEKDSGIVRYGICVNFFRPFERKTHSSEKSRDRYDHYGDPNKLAPHHGDTDHPQRSPRTRRRLKTASRVRNNTLTSLCIVSHHPFFSTFRECLLLLRKLIDACHDRSCTRRIGGSKGSTRDTVWSVLTGQCTDSIPGLVLHEIREIEIWMLRLLSAPVPVPAKTRVEVQVLPKDMVSSSLLFALPDHTRFTLVDFPLHLPLELLGVETCLRVLTLILLEHKIVLQSRDYNALSMSVMAFVSMLYPLEYMFPVIPLLPTCMSSAEQLLLVPTPYIIGVPSSFFLYKAGFTMPDDVWLVDLDSNKIQAPTGAEELPLLPDHEGGKLKNHLKQALASMSMTPQPIKNLDALAQSPELLKRRESFDSNTGFNPLIYGNDVDSVDVATRVAMVRFFNSPNILGNFSEHTRTLRLYPRPVVAFQLYSFLKSRPVKTHFTAKLARTQAVEFYAEWSLCPSNVVFLRVQTAVYDPSLIGDKPKWYSHQLQPVEFKVYDSNSSLGAALTSASEIHSDDNPTDESGSDSDGADSTSSSYSSLSDFVTDMVNSEIDGDTPIFVPENQILAVDHSKIFSPPSKLLVPETNISTNESSLTTHESDGDSSASSSPTYSQDNHPSFAEDQKEVVPDVFQYDPQNTSVESKLSNSSSRSVTGGGKPGYVQPLSSSASSQAPVVPSLKSNTNEKRNTPYSLPLSDRTQSLESPVGPSRTSGTPSYSSQKPAFGAISTAHTSGKRPLKLKQLSESSDKSPTASSIMSTISSELSGLAQSTSSTLSGFLGELAGNNRSVMPNFHSKPQNKPFAPLGNRRARVEKSGLVKQATSQRPREITRQQSTESRPNSNSENQSFLKEIISSVVEGHGVSWLKINRLKKLMEDENYRNFVVSRLNKNLDKKLTDDSQHIEDVCVNRQVFKGMLTVLRAMVHGLEYTYTNYGLGGMASAFMVLEILHTHYWLKEVGNNSNKSEASVTPEISSPYGSRESLSSKGSPVIINGEEFENIEIASVGETTSEDAYRDTDAGEAEEQSESDKSHSADQTNTTDSASENVKSCDIVVTGAEPDKQSADTESDILHDLVRNKELLKARKKNKVNSIDSEVSDGSTLVSSSSDNQPEEERRQKPKVSHHLVRNTVSDSEMELSGMVNYHRRSRSSSIWSTKSNLSAGFRYHDGKMINTSPLPSPETGKTYLFEGLIGKERSRLWDSMQFWEDMFLDAVAQERDIIGMDQGPGEMMERYNSLGDSEKKRLEHDEDKLLSDMLYNHIGFMVMMDVKKPEIKKKIRRLLGKSHIGLQYSQDVNNLLDEVNKLNGNDIDLKPMGSRLMQKQSFTVHWGSDNTGDMLFMEVCDDCIILRSVTGAICDRWWYEKLVNMTYCPKTKVLCLWRKYGERVHLNQFYTKKCRELYFCVKETMDKAAARNNGKVPGPDIGGEFPVQDLRSGQGGLLQVCMDGIGFLLANSKDFEFFIELCRVKKCFTQKGGIFVLEEFDPKTRQVIPHKFKSSMADQICYAVLCVFSYVAAGIENGKLTKVHSLECLNKDYSNNNGSSNISNSNNSSVICNILQSSAKGSPRTNTSSPRCSPPCPSPAVALTNLGKSTNEVTTAH